MVNLPEEIPRNSGTSRSSQKKVLRFRYCNYDFFISRVPTELVDLEDLADIVAVVSSHMDRDKFNKIRQRTMDKVRAFLNLEFKFYCERCGTAHHQDEISAPER